MMESDNLESINEKIDAGIALCNYLLHWLIIVAFLENATIGYSLESLCVCVCVCLCMCVCVFAR